LSFVDRVGPNASAHPAERDSLENTMHANPIGLTLERLTLGALQQHRNLTLLPLVAAETATQDYLTLDEALERHLARITELTEGGTVPELRFDNLSDQRILLLDGEELVGAKQNRVLNITILVAGHAQIVIPVSCVERGRWHHLSREFHSAKRAMYARARAAKMAQVSRSLRSHGSRRSDQSAVWADIEAKSERMGSHSATEAMAAMYEQECSSLEDYAQAFRPKERQVGAVFAINGQILGAELFDSAAVFDKLLQKLVGSYAMDAIEEPQQTTEALAEQAVRDFLSRIQASSMQSFPAVGEGQDLRLQGRGISGGALLADGRVVHLSAFSVAE
jgi:hypothetical protein